ncbi:TPA: hypothetical protein ACK0CK_002636 [Staphylococcus aureus]
MTTNKGSKPNKIRSYINAHEHEIVNGDLDARDIAKKFGISIQNVYYHASIDGESVFTRRDRMITYNLKQIKEAIKEGIPLDVIIQQPYAVNVVSDVGKNKINRAKDLIVSRMEGRQLVSKNEHIEQFVLVIDKLKYYITSIQIEKTLNSYKSVNKRKLSKTIGVSYQKVLKVSDIMKKPPFRTMAKSSDELYEIVKRNVEMTETYIKEGRYSKVYDSYKDINKKTVKLIIQSYLPHIKKELLKEETIQEFIK